MKKFSVAGDYAEIDSFSNNPKPVDDISSPEESVRVFGGILKQVVNDDNPTINVFSVLHSKMDVYHVKFMIPKTYNITEDDFEQYDNLSVEISDDPEYTMVYMDTGRDRDKIA